MAGTVRRNGPSTQGSWDCPHGVISLDTLLDGLGSLGIWVYRPRSWKNPITEISKESQIYRISGSPDLHILWISGSMDPRGPGDMETMSLWVMTHKTIDGASALCTTPALGASMYICSACVAMAIPVQQCACLVLCAALY